MKDDFSVLIQNRTEFEKGNPAGVYLSLPATKEELHETMKALNITADNPHDFFLNGYSTDEKRRIDIPFDWIRDGDLDKINFLAARLEEMTTEQLEKLDAVMHSDFKPESLNKLIDHTYNTDFYSYVPGILSYKELGDYFLNDSGKVQMPEEWKAGIDKEDFGFNAALHEDGKLTDYGYIARSGTDWKDLYTGQETPEQYHIMGYPEAERTDPENDEREAAPVDIAAANPIRPIELTAQKPAEKIKEITDRLEQGIQDLFDSDRFKEYLRVMSKFHDYSFNNTLLIAMQKPDATLVAGYTSWKKDYGRQVVSHAKSIKVLAPSPYKIKKEVDKIDPQTQKPVIGKDGKPVKEETEITVPAFKVVSVFDVSQTEGKELPTIGVDELTGDVEQYADFFKAVTQASPAPVGFEKIESGAKGYYSQTDKRIAINEGMSELQNLKTLIHEIAHAKLHDIDLNAPAKEQADRPDRRTREVQAESIAYAVCQHYGLDTSDYSFSYVAQWSSGRELPELKASLKTIRDTAAGLIADIDKNFAELTQNKEQAQETPENEPTAEPPQEETADATEGYEPYAAELPDPSITVSDMQEYGYTWDGMLPLKEEAALHLYEKEDMQIFLLHADGSESIPDSPEDIKAHAEKGGIFGVHKEDWNALTEYRAMKEELAASAPEKEMHLLYGKGDAFGIYQLKDGAGMRDYHFEPYDRLQAAGLSVDATNYDLIYTAELMPGTSLEDIYTRFNNDHPKDFKGHSLSVSDIVVLHQNGENTAHYVDRFGYREVPEFLREQTQQLTPDELTTGEQITTPRGSFSVTAMTREQMEAAGYGFHHQSDNGKYLIMGNGTRAFAIAAEPPENYLKATEQTTEQNGNMIDGIINNTPNTDALEAKANAGEQISLADLADAIQKDREAANAEHDTARITAAAKTRYEGMTALYTMDDKIYIGKSENYDNKGHYDNSDNSLLYVSDCQAAFTFLSSEGCTDTQEEALNRGIYTKEDYEEFSRITDFLSQAGFTPEKEFFFADKPFSLHDDTPEQTAPEAKTIYYTINEGAARRANDMNSFSDYKPGSATAEYRQMVDKAVEIGERQKKRVDPMYHEKIDSLVDTYARKLAENMNSSFSIEARVPSILIAGGSNFPVRKKEKQNAAREKNYSEWNDIQGLLDKIRSTGTGGISADDPQAIQKLEAKLEKLQASQDTMKAVNAYYRKHKTLDGCPNLSAERIEKMKGEMSSQWHIEDKPYPSWALSNNNAEIRRVKGRIAELTRKQETPYAGWEFDGGTVEANREDNRLQIFFEEKPDEKTREALKENGFRWSPKAGAWQRQLNDNAIYVADGLSCIHPLSGKSPTEIQKKARTAAKTEKKPSIRAQLAQDKEALKAAPKKAAEKTKKQDLERS